MCAQCGSKRVRRRRVSIKLRSGRKISGIEADVCDACGERYYDLEAMRRLEMQSDKSR